MKKSVTSLTGALKDKLIRQALQRQLEQVEQASLEPATQHSAAGPDPRTDFSRHPGYQQLRILHDGAARLGLPNPFFKLHQGTAGAHTDIDGQQLLNFASYNYLGCSGHPAVNQAAIAAIEQYGTSVSASRPVAGERPLHRELEQALADAYQVDAAVVLVSGHATNVTTIGYLFGPRDLILHDELVHNSILQGCQLSGATRLPFGHNNLTQLQQMLREHRHNYERVLIVVEGIYSMDGDFPDLPALVALKQQYQALLMVDEAHSFGVMGARGLGIREHFDLPGDVVDIWMGTLSKSLAGCGGYIAGSYALIEHLKFLAPGFLYSVGMPPPVAGAALAALQLMLAEPDRVQRLQHNGQYFLRAMQQAGFNTGHASGYAVVPAIFGSSIRVTQLANRLQQLGISVMPILYPAVPEQSARLRYFICEGHTEAEFDHAVQLLSEAARA